MLAYALTVFAGAFLLFQIQPLIGKYLLPWFGGGPGVWTTCLFFFQSLLVGGYAYAHLLTRYCPRRFQTRIHLGMLILSVVSLPIVPSEGWKPRPAADPTTAILWLLAVNIGVPYLVLAATGPLLQFWFASSDPKRSPYRLYALSNVGSLLALISYPVLFEPYLTRKSQALVWEWGLVVYCIGCAMCALKAAPGATKEQKPQDWQDDASEVQSSEAGSRKFLWMLWPAVASTLLLATTNKLCLDVAVFPLLWVLPLSVYLLSFILCFAGSNWYPRLLLTWALPAALGVVCWALWHGATWPFSRQVCAYSAGLFVVCMVCHGELYRLRPTKAGLTEFYLWVALGGALGGLFVAVGAPAIFAGYYELHWGIALCGLLVAGTRTIEVITSRLKTGVISNDSQTWNRKDWNALGLALLWLSFLVLAGALYLQGRRTGSPIAHQSRNFYGVLTVLEYRKEEPNAHYFLLQHGRITHGLQLVAPQFKNWATTYYGPESGFGRAMQVLPGDQKRVGVVGLGTGTIAAFAKPGDYFRFYEINPQVSCVATSIFSYLPDCKGRFEIVPGDARLALEQSAPQSFDLLALDAFDSDSIPVHLLTQQAFEIYLKHLKPGGILAVHISNHFLDLEPVVAGLANHFGLRSALIDHDAPPEEWWFYSSTWVLLARDGAILDLPAIQSGVTSETTKKRSMPLWTDDYSSLFSILR